MSNVVYRALNAEGDILYVGVTRDPVQRFSFHEYQTPWWNLVDHVELSQEFLERRDAEDAEARAISTLRPLFNKHYPIFPEGAQVAEFAPYDYTPETNFPAAMRRLETLDMDARRAAMELAFKPITDVMNGRSS